MPDLAEIFRRAGPAYRERFGDRMLPSHQRAMQDIEGCRTPAMGGQLAGIEPLSTLLSTLRGSRERSEPETQHSYPSCKNRHCPRCQGDSATTWIEKMTRLLLPGRYYLVTFTIPEQLRTVARHHQRIVYDILLREAARTLLAFGADPKWVGGRLALLAVLHTWSRAMAIHPHVHILASAGGLLPGASAWIKPRNRKWLAPGWALSKNFRKRIEQAFRDAGLHHLAPPEVWDPKGRWVVHVKRLDNGIAGVKYLARYLYRVALNNRSIEAFDGESVTFRWQESKTGRTHHSRFDVLEFIRRFLQHVLPSGFVKVRYYGLWAPACRKLLDAAKRILEHHPGICDHTPSSDALKQDDVDPLPQPRVCPTCKSGHLAFVAFLPRSRAPP
jgi:hypothetical protein